MRDYDSPNITFGIYLKFIAELLERKNFQTAFELSDHIKNMIIYEKFCENHAPGEVGSVTTIPDFTFQMGQYFCNPLMSDEKLAMELIKKTRILKSLASAVIMNNQKDVAEKFRNIQEITLEFQKHTSK